MCPTGVSQKTIQVLLVEDSRIVRLGLSAFLNNDPLINVAAEAESGEEAIQIVSTLPIDLAVVDLGLPGISGIETMARLKKIQPELRMIVLTSHQQRE